MGLHSLKSEVLFPTTLWAIAQNRVRLGQKKSFFTVGRASVGSPTHREERERERFLTIRPWDAARNAVEAPSINRCYRIFTTAGDVYDGMKETTEAEDSHLKT